MIRVADYIIEFLESKGIEDVFTVTGGGCIFLCDALAVAKKMKYWCCHHEQAVAMATEAYSRMTGNIGVSLVTTGPGATNAITGVVGSWVDSVPHLILSGQAFLKQTIADSGLRQLGVQEINIIDLIKPITKYALLVDDAQTIRYHLEKALYLAKTGRPGPVWLDLPADIQNARIDPSALKGFTPTPEDKPITDSSDDLQQKVAQVVERLRQSKRPLIHVGQGVRLAGATKYFMEFVEKHQLPFVTARNANDLVPSDHNLFVGRPGTFPQRGANFALQNSDFYLAVGTRLSIPQTGYNAKDFARQAYKVMVDIDQAELNKKTLALDLKVCADVKDFLVELLRQLPKGNYGSRTWIDQCLEWKRDYYPVLPTYKDQKKWINSYYFIDQLSEVLGHQDVVVTDMGIAFQGTHQALRVKSGQRFFTNSGCAAMGWGLPAAIGACIAHDRKRVTCITGDGGLMMNVQELATVALHKLPIKIFILNNQGYLTIKQTQQLGFGGRLMGVNSETGVGFPHFQKLAESHGIPSVYLENHVNLQENIQAVIESDGPCVCEIMMDPDQDQAPKAINRRKPDGTMEPTPLEDLWPYLDRDELARIMEVSSE